MSCSLFVSDSLWHQTHLVGICGRDCREWRSIACRQVTSQELGMRIAASYSVSIHADG